MTGGVIQVVEHLLCKCSLEFKPQSIKTIKKKKKKKRIVPYGIVSDD
jgi:hypothetical protein